MEQIAVLRDTLVSHTDMETAIVVSAYFSPIVVSSTRDKSVLIWKIKDDGTVVPHRRLTGHSHFVEDVGLNSDGQLAFSASWDGVVRLWDVATGSITSRFVGHTKDVLSVTISPDNRQIVSGGRDRTIKVWNSLGECKCTIEGADIHTEWVSRVRFNPSFHKPVLVSGSWDRTRCGTSPTACSCTRWWATPATSTSWQSPPTAQCARAAARTPSSCYGSSPSGRRSTSSTPAPSSTRFASAPAGTGRASGRRTTSASGTSPRRLFSKFSSGRRPSAGKIGPSAPA
ncbi:unnamed protein product [Musa textilis]